MVAADGEGLDICRWGTLAMSASHKELGEGDMRVKVKVEAASAASSSESSATAVALGSIGGVCASIAVVFG